MAASFPPNKGCEVLDGEVTDEEWDKNHNKNVADSDYTQILINRGPLYSAIGGILSRSANDPSTIMHKRVPS